MRTSTSGFTLIELMVTLAVLAIVLSAATPSFNAQLQNNRAVAVGDEMASALSYARGEAVKNARRVTVCASRDGATCAGTWDEGFIVFIDSAVADDAAPDPTLGALKTWGKNKHSATLTARFDGSADTAYVRFTALGAFARPSSGATRAQIDIALKGCSGRNAPRITVNLTGMVSTTRQDCPKLL